MVDVPTIKAMKEALPVVYRLHVTEQAAAHEEERYQRERRDGLIIRIRGSLVALHGASLVALLGLSGGDASGAKWLGLGREPLFVSAVLFMLGLLAAGLALTAEQNLAIEEAGDACARAGHLDRIVALFEDPAGTESLARIEKAETDFQKAPLSGFKFSNLAITAQHWSGIFWFLGTVIPIGSSLL